MTFLWGLGPSGYPLGWLNKHPGAEGIQPGLAGFVRNTRIAGARRPPEHVP